MEYADLEKRAVYFPAPYAWDEEEVIHNTDGTRGTVAARYGGEINTPPMLLRHSDVDVFRKVVESCKEHGAIARRDCGLQVHIFVGDITEEELKKIFYLAYHTTPILKELCNLPPYCDEQRYRPSPTLEHYLRLKKSKSFSDIRTTLENSHNKGFVRYFVNVASYFVRQTIEFRLFNSSTDFWEIMDCVMFSYRFVDYALRHDEEDFMKIKTREDFVRELKVANKYPALPPPLLFFSSIKRMDVGDTAHDVVLPNKSFMSELLKDTDEIVTCVNPVFFSTEIRLKQHKQKVIVYCNDEFNHLLYRMVREGFRIKYSEDVKELADLCEDNVESQVACLLVFSKLCKFLNKNNPTYEKKLGGILSRVGVSYEKAIKSAKRIITFLEQCEYHLGTLNDAIAEQTGDIYFSFDDYKHFRTVIGYLRRNSDYADTFNRKSTHYLNVVEQMPSDRRLFVMSEFPYHNMQKLYKKGALILYSNKAGKAELTLHPSRGRLFSAVFPPDDLVIEDASKLLIVKCKSWQFDQIRAIFMKKVQVLGNTIENFFIYYDQWLIGGIGFGFSKKEGFDCSLIADFGTNSKIPRLSKLVVLMAKSSYIKRALSRAMKSCREVFYTKAFTARPVSMKYRGVLKKVAQERNCLLYTGELGSSGTFEDIVKEYKQICERAKK